MPGGRPESLVLKWVTPHQSTCGRLTPPKGESDPDITPLGTKRERSPPGGSDQESERPVAMPVMIPQKAARAPTTISG